MVKIIFLCYLRISINKIDQDERKINIIKGARLLKLDSHSRGIDSSLRRVNKDLRYL